MKYNVLMVKLGCSKNRVDAEEMLGLIKQAGYNIVEDAQKADVVIINTCGFIESAKQESIDEVFKYAPLKEQGRLKYIVMTGCLAQRYYDVLKDEMPEVDAFVGVTAFDSIVEVLERLGEKDNITMNDIDLPCPLGLPRVTDDNDVYGYLKIAEGCDNRCSYCAIPAIRGRFRSKPLDAVLKEAKELAERGKKEIIVIAQDITRYGMDLDGNISLITLLDELQKIEGIEWIRMMYLNPMRVSDELIDFVAENAKILPYFDIPIQHICTDVLKRMHREADSEKIYHVFSYVKERIPEASLRSTFITGFPGETDEEFKELLHFVKEAKIDNLGVFTYSAEDGTVAAEMPDQIDPEISQKRANKIMALQKKLVSASLKAKRGETVDVIIEGKQRNGKYYGRSYREAPEIDGIMYINSERELKKGDIVRMKITNTYDYDSEGDVI